MSRERITLISACLLSWNQSGLERALSVRASVAAELIADYRLLLPPPLKKGLLNDGVVNDCTCCSRSKWNGARISRSFMLLLMLTLFLRIQSVHMLTGNFVEMVDANYAIIGSTMGSGSQQYVRVLSTLDRE